MEEIAACWEYGIISNSICLPIWVYFAITGLSFLVGLLIGWIIAIERKS